MNPLAKIGLLWYIMGMVMLYNVPAEKRVFVIIVIAIGATAYILAPERRCE